MSGQMSRGRDTRATSARHPVPEKQDFKISPYFSAVHLSHTHPAEGSMSCLVHPHPSWLVSARCQQKLTHSVHQASRRAEWDQEPDIIAAQIRIQKMENLQMWIGHSVEHHQAS